jgi:hypothetical protein
MCKVFGSTPALHTAKNKKIIIINGITQGGDSCLESQHLEAEAGSF